jgi:hypothetical protein
MRPGSGEGGVSSVVTGMSPGSSKRWGGGEATVGISGESPAALMDHPMMGPTEQGQIGQVGPGGSSRRAVTSRTGSVPAICDGQSLEPQPVQAVQQLAQGQGLFGHHRIGQPVEVVAASWSMPAATVASPSGRGGRSVECVFGSMG